MFNFRRFRRFRRHNDITDVELLILLETQSLLNESEVSITSNGEYSNQWMLRVKHMPTGIEQGIIYFTGDEYEAKVIAVRAIRERINLDVRSR